MHHINGAVLVPVFLLIGIGLVKLFDRLDRKDRELVAEAIKTGRYTGGVPRCYGVHRPEPARNPRRW